MVGWQIIQSSGAIGQVLRIDSVNRDVNHSRADTVDGRCAVVRVDARLGVEQFQRITQRLG